MAKTRSLDGSGGRVTRRSHVVQRVAILGVSTPLLR